MKHLKAVTDGIGGPCPKCGKPMQRYKHPPAWRPRPGHDWFKYWDRCHDCVYFQHYEVAKVKAGQQPEVVHIPSLFA